MAPKEMETHHSHEAAPAAVLDARAQLPAPVSAASTVEPASASVTRCTGEKKKPTTKKRLRWSTITIHEFGVGLGGSSVPSKGGPSIGLADTPEFTWTTKVGEMAECSEGIRRFTSDERVNLLQAAGVSDGMILRFSRETNIILTSRKRTHNEIMEEKRAKKRKLTTMASMERPCPAFLNRPRMIPVNYA